MAFETNIIICTIDGNEKCSELGFVKVKQNATYADVRKAIELDEIDGLEGHEFVFLGQRKLPLSKRQEERYKVTDEEVFVRINEAQEVFQPIKRRRLVINQEEEEDVDVAASIEELEQPRTNEEKESLISECEGRLESKFASRALTCKWIHTFRKYRMKMKSQGKKDRFELMSYDINGVGMFSIWCVECNLKYGRGGDDMMYNFTARHMESKEHKLNLHKHLQSVDGNEESMPKEVSTSEVMAENRAAVEECMALKVAPFVEQSGVVFELYKETLGSYAKKEEICILCVLCKRPLLLFPSRGDVLDNMKEHIKSSRHAQKATTKERNEMHEEGKHGRPRKDVVDSSQKSMLSFFARDHSNEAGTSHPNENSRTIHLGYLCWGFWQLTYRYGSKTRDLRSFLDESLSGLNWYCEAQLCQEFIVDGKMIKIQGTIRHVKCARVSTGATMFPNFQCSYCAAIPKERDLRMRVYRQSEEKVERGLRSTKSRMRVDYLTKSELSKLAKETRIENRDLRTELRLSKVRTLALSVKVKSLRETLCESMKRGDVHKFCMDIKEAYSSGKFEGKSALWNFLTDIAQNILRPGHKKRYKKTTKELFETIKIWGGKRMHNFLSVNFGGPNLSTTKRSTGDTLSYKAGINEETFVYLAKIYSSCVSRCGLIHGNVPTIVAEDETVIKRVVQWCARDDSLVGFCGKKEDHACVTDFVVHVGSGEEGYKTILDAFEMNVVAHYARVLIVNPLHARLPKLVLSIQLTCNRFDHNAVRCQWDQIDHFWNLHLRGVLGPLIGHSSDGDARRRACMLEDYTSLKETGRKFAIPWEGWVFSAAMNKDGSTHGLHDQDFIHNGKKLINPLDNASRRLYLGSELVTLNDVWHVFHTFQGEHGLQIGDVERRDRQNWRAAQRIASRRVRDCLKRLRDPKHSTPMRTLGTETYLYVISLYIDIFLSPHMDLWNRIRAASTVSFFLRLWRLWISGHEEHSLKTNFISRETFLDVQLSCHFVVLLIRFFRDYCRELAVPLDATGSDACENFFSKIGGMVRNERSYTGADVLDSASALNRVAEFQSQGVLKFPAAHAKQENIWQVLERKSDGEGKELKCDLAEYTLVGTDEMIVDALKAGLRHAKELCAQVGVICEETGEETWWSKPWKHENFFNKDYFKELDTSIIGDESDDVILEQENDEIIAINGDMPNEVTAQLELRHTFDSMVDEIETPSLKKIERNVMVDSKPVCKGTLVSQLNGNPWLSKDRLTKVKLHSIISPQNKLINAATSLGIGSDCAIYFEMDSRSKKEQNKKDVMQVWYLGRVLNMRKKLGRAWKETREPVDLVSRPAYSIELNLAWYNEHKAGRRVWYSFDLSDSQSISLDSVIALASLTYNPDNGRYQLDDHDMMQFDNFLADQRKGNKGKSKIA